MIFKIRSPNKYTWGQKGNNDPATSNAFPSFQPETDAIVPCPGNIDEGTKQILQ